MPDSRDSNRGELVLLGSSVRAAAESASASGWIPIAVDLFGDRQTLCAASRWQSVHDFRTAFLQHGLDSIVDPAVPLAIVGGLQQGWRWLADLPPSRFLTSLPQHFPQSSCPQFLAMLATQAGVNFPDTELASDNILRSSRVGWLIKRRSTSGGLGVSFCTSPPEQEFLDSHQPTEASDPDSYLQRRVPGKSFGASFVSDGRLVRLIGVCRSLRKRLGNLPFVYAGAVGPIPIPETVSRQLSQLGEVFVAQTGLRGPFNLDVIVDGTTVTLLEANPRYSGSMELIERSMSDLENQPRSLFEPPANWIDGSRILQPPSVPYIKRVLFARDTVTIGPDPDALPRLPLGLSWTDTPARSARVPRGEPVATLIGRLDRISRRDTFRIRVPPN